MLKTCSKCGQSKPTNEYFVKDKRVGKLHAQCKVCYQIHRMTYYAEHYQKNKASYLLRAKQRREKLRLEFRSKILEYLSDKRCFVCGESDTVVLEFDHLEPAEKTFTISQAVKLGFKWDEVVNELKKCQVLCANCHKRRTAQQFNWYKMQ